MPDACAFTSGPQYLWLFVLLALLIPLPVTLRDELDRDGDLPGEWN